MSYSHNKIYNNLVLMSTKDETSALSGSGTVDDISNDIGTMALSNNIGASAAAVACDMSTSKKEMMSSKKKDTSCDQKLEHTKTRDDIDICGTCTDDTAEESCDNCGKEGAKNTCNKCKMVKYCNAACKKKHKSKHKKACERRVAELRDIELFKQPPQKEDDCPICFIRLPLLGSGKKYKSCCGKVICSGCIHAVIIRDTTETAVPLCPFCRVAMFREDETDGGKRIIQQIMKRVDAGDAEAINNLGFYYSQGMYGLPRDFDKALELRLQAAELGHKNAYYNIGNAHLCGRGVHYWELGAMRGCATARHILGAVEERVDNTERALKHFMLAVRSGSNTSLKEIQKLFANGKATKDDYTKALRIYQEYISEVKSPQREEAAAANKNYKYYK